MIFQLVSRCYSWFGDKLAQKVHQALLAILAAGPVPKHVAFIMDGNRRYARKNHKLVQQGHSDGFIALRGVLEVCLRLNVQCVSVYAFAIENFRRPQDEVDALMQLAEERLYELCQHGDLLDRYGVRLNVLGKTQMLPPQVQKAVRKAEEMTCKNSKAILNLCMPYASSDDMATAAQAAVRVALEKDDPSYEITVGDVEAHLMTSAVNSPPLDILVRTSGVKRLSDYLLWQCCEDTQLQFASTYWPEFGLWDFIPIILDFQRKVWSKSSDP